MIISGTRSTPTSARAPIIPPTGRRTRRHAFRPPPRVADTFCGSGQIPFEAARLGCDVYASDLNPVACMLTWGAVKFVGGSKGEPRSSLTHDQQALVERVQAEIDRLGVETDGRGWIAKGLPLLRRGSLSADGAGWRDCCPLAFVSKGRRVNSRTRAGCLRCNRYDLAIRSKVSERRPLPRPRRVQCAPTGGARYRTRSTASLASNTVPRSRRCVAITGGRATNRESLTPVGEK